MVAGSDSDGFYVIGRGAVEVTMSDDVGFQTVHRVLDGLRDDGTVEERGDEVLLRYRERNFLTASELEEYIDLTDQEREAVAALKDTFPLKITRHYANLIRNTPPDDPLRRMVIPSSLELLRCPDDDAWTCMAMSPDISRSTAAGVGPPAIARALGHPARVRFVRFLPSREGRTCGDIVGRVPLAQSTVSQHLQTQRGGGDRSRMFPWRNRRCLSTSRCSRRPA